MTSMETHASRTRAKWLAAAMKRMKKPKPIRYWMEMFDVCRNTVCRTAQRIGRPEIIDLYRKPVRVGRNSGGRLKIEVPDWDVRKAGLTYGQTVSFSPTPGSVRVRGEK